MQTLIKLTQAQLSTIHAALLSIVSTVGAAVVDLLWVSQTKEQIIVAALSAILSSIFTVLALFVPTSNV